MNAPSIQYLFLGGSDDTTFAENMPHWKWKLDFENEDFSTLTSRCLNKIFLPAKPAGLHTGGQS
jgi:hypothetical protein